MGSANQSAAANRRPAGRSDGSSDLSAIVAADRAFPAAVAELGSFAQPTEFPVTSQNHNFTSRTYE